jgi:hypothetical protein
MGIMTAESNLPGRFGGVELPKHLQRMKNGAWRVRVVVPPPLVSLVGKATLTYPLGTNDEHEAISRSAKKIAEFREIISEANHQLPNTLSSTNIHNLRWYYVDDDPFFNFTRRGQSPSIFLLPVFLKNGELEGYRSPREGDPLRKIVAMVRLWADSRSRRINRKTWAEVVGKITRLADFIAILIHLLSPLMISPVIPPPYLPKG